MENQVKVFYIDNDESYHDTIFECEDLASKGGCLAVFIFLTDEKVRVRYKWSHGGVAVDRTSIVEFAHHHQMLFSKAIFKTGFQVLKKGSSERGSSKVFDILVPRIAHKYDTDVLDVKNLLFLTEIKNDLDRHGFVEGGKADTMLSDWHSELLKGTEVDEKHIPALFCEVIGVQNW